MCLRGTCWSPGEQNEGWACMCSQAWLRRATDAHSFTWCPLRVRLGGAWARHSCCIGKANLFQAHSNALWGSPSEHVLVFLSSGQDGANQDTSHVWPSPKCIDVRLRKAPSVQVDSLPRHLRHKPQEILGEALRPWALLTHLEASLPKLLPPRLEDGLWFVSSERRCPRKQCGRFETCRTTNHLRLPTSWMLRQHTVHVRPCNRQAHERRQ
eukprot:23535-Amphidinium_carterae.1